MSSIDERIVEMRFDNKDFENNVQQTMTTLDKLKSALNFKDATKSFENITQAADNVSLESIADSLSAIENRFSAFGIVGMRVLENLTDAALRTAKKITSFVTDAIIGGGVRRAMNLEKAHFQLQGLLEDEEEVAAVMKDVNASVDGTAYSLDAAASVAAQLSATGLKATEYGGNMLDVLQAISGVAAMTDSTFEEVGHIFTTVAGNGRLMGMQLQQFSNKGLNVAAAIAKAFGTTEEDIRDRVSRGLISFNDFAMAMQDQFGDHAYKANETINGALSNVKSALARIGALFISPLVEQNGELVQLLNTIRLKINDIKGSIGPIANVFVNAVKSMARSADYLIGSLDIGDRIKKRLELLDLWTKFGGYKTFAEGMSYLFDAIIQRIRAIGDAFASVFGTRGKYSLGNVLRGTRNFRDFTQSLLLTERQLYGIESIARVVFKVLKFGFDIVKVAIKIVFKPISLVIGLIEILEHSILSLIGNFAFAVNWLWEAIKGSETFKKVVDGLRDGFYKLKKFFSLDFLKSTDVFGKISDFIDNLSDRLKKFGTRAKVNGKAIASILDSQISLFFDWAKSVKNAVVESEAWNTLSAIGSGILDSLVYVFEEVKNGAIEFYEVFSQSQFVKNISTWTEKIYDFVTGIDYLGIVSGYFESFVGWLSSIAGKKIELPKIDVASFAGKVSDYLFAVQTEFGKFWSWIKEKAPLVVGFFINVGKKVKEFFGILKGNSETKLHDIFQFFKDLGASIVPKVSKAFSDLKDKIKGILPKETVDKWKDFVGTLRDFKDKILEKLAGKSDDAGSSLEELGQKILDFIKQININPQTLLAIGLLIFLGVLISNITKILKYIEGVAGAFKTLIGTLKSKLAGVLAQNTKILQLAIFVGTVAYAIYQLSKIPAKDLKTTVLWFTGAVVSLVGAFLLLQWLTNVIDKKYKHAGPDLTKVTSALAIFAGSIILVLIALEKASKLVGTKNLVSSVLLMVTIMGLLIGAAFLLREIKMDKKSILGMLALAVFAISVGKVFSALAELTKVVTDPDKFAEIVLALVPVMVGLGVLAFGAGQVSLPSAIALLALVKLLQVVLPMLSSLSDEDIDHINEFVKKNALLFIALAALGVIMLAISARTKAGNSIKKAGVGILAMGAAFYVIAMAIEKLGGLDKGKLEQGLSTLAIIALIIALLEILSFATRFNAFPKFAKGMLIVSAVFVIFALIMRILAKLDDAAVMKGLIVLVVFGVILGVLMGLSALTKKVKIGPIIAIAATLVVLGGILIALSLIPWTDLWHSGLVFGGVLIALCIAFGVIFHNLKKLTKNNSIGLLLMLGMIGTIWLIGHVLEKLASLDWLNLLIAGISMALCLGVFAAAVSSVVDLVKAAGKSNKAGIGYLGVMVGVIAAIGASLWAISRNPWLSILMAGAAMTAALWMLGKTLEPITELASAKKLNKQGIGYLGVMCGVIVALGVAMAIMATQPWLSVLMAGVSMALALGAFGVCCKLLTDLATAKQVNFKSLAYIAAMILVMGVIATAMYFLADKPWQGLIAAGAGMALVLIGLAACIGVLSLVKASGPQILTAAASVIVLSLALIAIGYAMSFVAGFPADQIYATAISFVGILVALGIVIAILGNVGWVAGAAAAANLIEFVGLLSAGIIALAELWDAVKESLGGTDAVLSKIEALGLIFEAVGAAIGKIITGFLNSIGQGVEEMVSHMPAVANYLSTFMSKMSSVYAMAGTQKDDKIEKFDKIIASVTGLNKFSVSLSDIEKFKDCAEPFGEAIAAYAKSIENVTSDDIDRADDAASIAEKVVLLNDKLPREGSWLDKILGIKDLDSFSSQMEGFGEAISTFCTSIANLTNADKLHADYAEKVATPVLNIAANLGRKDGLIQKVLGKQWTLEDFGKQMNKFADCVIEFADKIKDFTDCSEQANALRDSATPMLEFAGEMERNGGIIDWVIGKKTTLDDFGTQMTSFAESLLTYCETINDKAINLVRMDAVTESISKMSNMVSALDGWDSNNLDTFEDSLEAIGNMSIASAVNDLWAYKDVLIENLDQIFGGAASHIETVNQPDMVEKASGIINAMCEGIKSTTSVTNMTSAISALMTKSKTGFNSATSDGYNAGRDFIQGFINGLRGTNQYALTAVYSIGRSLFYKFKESLDEKSPSKLTEEAGMFFMQGFINGLGDMEQSAKRKVTSVASGTIEAMSTAVDKAVDYFNDNMDASPVIRPVLDLSSISAGTGAMQGMFGSYSMRFATTTSGSVRASVESQTRLDALSDRLDTAIAKIGEIIQNESDRAENTNYMFEIPFAIDGREFARASATYNQEELNRLTRNMQRREGYR